MLPDQNQSREGWVLYPEPGPVLNPMSEQVGEELYESLLKLLDEVGDDMFRLSKLLVSQGFQRECMRHPGGFERQFMKPRTFRLICDKSVPLRDCHGHIWVLMPHLEAPYLRVTRT